MSYITENTIWPSVTELKPEIKNLIRRFYELADLPDPQSGNQYAIEIFTPNGTMKGPFGSGDIYVGEAEIRESKANAWVMVSSRRHQVKRVFVSDTNGLDLMLIGDVNIGLKNGRTVKIEYTARMLVDDQSLTTGSPKLILSSVWSDPTLVMSAMKEQ